MEQGVLTRLEASRRCRPAARLPIAACDTFQHLLIIIWVRLYQKISTKSLLECLR